MAPPSEKPVRKKSLLRAVLKRVAVIAVLAAVYFLWNPGAEVTLLEHYRGIAIYCDWELDAAEERELQAGFLQPAQK
jgi:hypothetical protein